MVLTRFHGAAEELGIEREADFLHLATLRVAEQFTGTPGKYVKLADTIRGFKEIVEGKHDDLPEQAFYMRGTIEEAIEAAKQMAAEAA